MTYVGIDFGTSNSVCYICEKRKSESVSFGTDQRLLPSCLYKTGEKVVVGMAAKSCLNSVTVIRNVKRLIGKKYDSVDHKDDVKIYGADAVKGSDGYCWFMLDDGNLYSCVDIASFIFASIKEEAAKIIDYSQAEAVISVPAYYSGIQRECIREAAVKAGWNVMYLVNEPTAAAVSYGGDNVCRSTILVFDLGGGTLDVTILSMQGGVYRVESTYGDDSLGGNDFTMSLLHLVEELFDSRFHCSMWSLIPSSKLKTATKHIMSVIEDAKEELSVRQQVELDLSDCSILSQKVKRLAHSDTEEDEDDDDLTFCITRREFEKCIEPLLNRCLEVTKKAMTCGKRCFTRRDIEEVIMIGGGSMIPAVKSKIVNGSIGKSFPEINRMEEVAKGCCECAKKHNRPDFRIFESLHTSIGIIYDEDKVFEIFPYGTELPATKSFTFYCNVPGAIRFRTQLVEIRDVDDKRRRELKTLESSDFLPNQTGYKELLFTFTITSESILVVQTYAMPENEKCLNVYVEELTA